MPDHWLVLPSPLLGPVSYHPLVDALHERERSATLAECLEPIRPDRLVAEWSRAAERADVLVAHSNAGYLAAAVGTRVGGRSIVYMDAALPPASGVTRPAPAAFLEKLREMAEVDGRLPPWTRWWSAEEMAEVLPGGWFERVDAAAPRVDLTYFETELRPPEEWSDGPSAYLAFGTTYAAELAFAREAGWPVAELPGHHLWHLARPIEVAAALDALAARLGQP